MYDWNKPAKPSSAEVNRRSVNTTLTESIQRQLDEVKTSDAFGTDGMTKKLGLVSEIIG